MATDVVIHVEGLYKEYILPSAGSGDQGLRHAVERAARVPLAWLRARTARARGPAASKHRESRAAYVRLLRGDRFYALQDVSLDVRQGEVLGIVGRNGAGKSTLLKILSRITEPTAGRIGINGRLVSLLEVGTGFHPELTGRENVFLNGSILGMKRSEITRKFDAIAAFAEIDDFLDVPVKRYSSGMYVRLAFAVASHVEPDILVVDEVLAVGDATFQKKCIAKMTEVSRDQGRTVLFVSHNLGAVQRLCSAAIALERGRIVARGTPQSVIEAYLAIDEEQGRRGFRRSGAAELSIHTESADGQVDAPISMGDAVRLIAQVKVDVPLQNTSLGIGVETPMGVRVLTFDSTLQHPYPWSVEKAATLVVEWPECILCPGHYRLVAALYDHGHVVGAWSPAGEMTVLESDYFGTGQLPDPSHQGNVVTAATWHIAEQA